MLGDTHVGSLVGLAPKYLKDINEEQEFVLECWNKNLEFFNVLTDPYDYVFLLGDMVQRSVCGRVESLDVLDAKVVRRIPLPVIILERKSNGELRWERRGLRRDTQSLRLFRRDTLNILVITS